MRDQHRVLFGQELDDDLNLTGDSLLVPFEVFQDDAVLLGAPGSGKTTFALRAIERALAAEVAVLALDTSGELTKAVSAGNLSSGCVRRLRIGLDDLGGYFRRPDLDSSIDLARHAHRLSTPLLSLLGYRTRGITPEMALLETLVLDRWQADSSPDLSQVAQLVMEPPMSRIGNFYLDTVISEERRSLLGSAIHSLGASQPDSQSDVTFDFEQAWHPNATALVLDFAQRSLETVRFVSSAALIHLQGYLEGDSAKVPGHVLVVIIDVDSLLPRHNRVPTTPIMREMLDRWSIYGVGCLLEVRDLEMVDELALELVETWISGRFPVGATRHLVVEELDLVEPPIDEVTLERNLARMEPGQFVVRSRHLPSLAYFQLDP